MREGLQKVLSVSKESPEAHFFKENEVPRKYIKGKLLSSIKCWGEAEG